MGLKLFTAQLDTVPQSLLHAAYSTTPSLGTPPAIVTSKARAASNEGECLPVVTGGVPFLASHIRPTHKNQSSSSRVSYIYTRRDASHNPSFGVASYF